MIIYGNRMLNWKPLSDRKYRHDYIMYWSFAHIKHFALVLNQSESKVL
jgi:hypothetical protein